MLKYTVMWNT